MYIEICVDMYSSCRQFVSSGCWGLGRQRPGEEQLHVCLSVFTCVSFCV